MSLEIERKPGAFTTSPTDLDWPVYTFRRTLAVDTFSRADGPLGIAETGQAWQALGPGAFEVGVSGQRIARLTSGTSSRILPVLETGKSDGVLTATLATAPSSAATASCGIAFRVQDGANGLYLSMRVSATDMRLALYKLVNGSASSISAPHPGITSKAGQVYRVEMQGTRVTIQVNGDHLLAVDVPEFADATKHGFTFTGTADAAFDSFEFSG